MGWAQVEDEARKARAALAAAEERLGEREADMHLRIRAEYDRGIADSWRAALAAAERDRDALMAAAGLAGASVGAAARSIEAACEVVDHGARTAYAQVAEERDEARALARQSDRLMRRVAELESAASDAAEDYQRQIDDLRARLAEAADIISDSTDAINLDAWTVLADRIERFLGGERCD